MWKIPLFDLDYGAEEEEAVLSVLRCRWLSMGEVTQKFEQAFADYTGARHAFAVANGTVALHLTCAAAGFSEGDEVIVPALTFVATAAAVRYMGATPVFADITSETDLTISPQSIERLVTPRTRGILVMHYAGYMCDMPAIYEIAQKHNLLVLEDAAHAPGSELAGKRAGAWGSSAAFSFFSNKNLATGEGGMVTTNDDAIADRVRRLRSHGMTTLTWDRHRGQALSYDVTDVGFNYRPTEILSALGLVQLAKLDRNNQRRRDVTRLYHDLLKQEVPTVGVPFQAHRGLASAHILPVVLPEGCDRPAFMNAMKTRGIQTSIHYPLIPNFSLYRESNPKSDLQIVNGIVARLVTLPLFAAMKDEDVETVVESVKESLRE